MGVSLIEGFVPLAQLITVWDGLIPAPVLHGMCLAAEGRQLRDVEQGWTVLQALGFHGTALCPSDVSPAALSPSPLAPVAFLKPVQLCLWALGTGGTQARLLCCCLFCPSLLRDWWLVCGICSPHAERNPPCRMAVDKSAPGETEWGC